MIIQLTQPAGKSNKKEDAFHLATWSGIHVLVNIKFISIDSMG